MVMSLAQSYIYRLEFILFFFKVDFDMEKFISIDFKVRTWAVCFWVNGENRFPTANSVTVIIYSIAASFTFMWSDLESMLVGLHQIQFRAPVTIAIGGITIGVDTCLFISCQLCKVKCRVLSTINISEMDTILNRTSKHGWLIISCWAHRSWRH
jgi:hypothetical protein